MSRRKFTLYWSNLVKYENCPKGFLWGRGWGAIDVGGGPGRKKPKPFKKSEHHALMGTVIALATEALYNKELWKSPRDLVRLLDEELDKAFRLELSKRYIDWRLSPSQEEMYRICRDGVMGFLKTFKHNRLVGPYARSEVDYVAYIDKYNPIGGRMDYLIEREDTGITILDGKNSAHKGKYTDPDQLRWYALCFYLSRGVMPNRLGFVYFRYPWGWMPPEEEWEKDENGNPIKPEPDTGIDWIPFTKDDLKGLAHRAVEARKGMEKEKFPATPVPSYCKFCDYESVCSERQAQIASNRRKPKNQEELFDGIGGPGFTDFEIK